MSKSKTITTEAQLREAAKEALEQDEVLRWRWKVLAPRPQRDIDALLELSLDRRKLVADVEQIAQWLLKCYPEPERVVFTQWFAANQRHPYTTPPAASAYVPSFPAEAIERKLGARHVTDGGTLWLVVSKDDGVCRETQQVGEFTLACDAQIYLDLLHVGLRGPDQAKALREWEGFGRSKV